MVRRAPVGPDPKIPPVRLGPEQGRVIGCLIEKQLTTPQQYPLTLNALLSACNQSSNRDPVVHYDDGVVDQALVSLKEAGLVRFVHPSHGRSTTRYRQVLDERFVLDESALAIVAALLLRGPQTAGELRIRTERMVPFEGIAAVDDGLRHMSGGTEPLVQRLPRRPGQKEERWAQLLAPGAISGVQTPDEGSGGTTGGVPEPATAGGDSHQPPRSAGESGQRAIPGQSSRSFGEQLSSLVEDVATLRAEVADLRAAFEQLQAGPAG
jgi:uncharacterized protein YceH (UPF0502 family)